MPDAPIPELTRECSGICSFSFLLRISCNDNLHDLYSQTVEIFGVMWNMKTSQIY